jgi:hypothetical protein
MSDNIKFINNLEKLLHEKEGDYGHFDHTAFVMGYKSKNSVSVLIDKLEERQELKRDYAGYSRNVILNG